MLCQENAYRRGTERLEMESGHSSNRVPKLRRVPAFITPAQFAGRPLHVLSGGELKP